MFIGFCVEMFSSKKANPGLLANQNDAGMITSHKNECPVAPEPVDWTSPQCLWVSLEPVYWAFHWLNIGISDFQFCWAADWQNAAELDVVEFFWYLQQMLQSTGEVSLVLTWAPKRHLELLLWHFSIYKLNIVLSRSLELSFCSLFVALFQLSPY